MQRILIVGAGGHAQVVADILMRAQDAGESIAPIGYVDDNPEWKGTYLLGLPVLGRIEDVSEIDHDALVIGIGNNHIRQKLFALLQQQGYRFAVAQHPRTVIAPDVHVGPGTVICAGAIINPGTTIGANVILNTGATVDHHNQIGNHVHIAPGVHLGGDVVVGEGTLIGIGATVMPQRRIGVWSIIGAAALAHIDVPDSTVVTGVPGRITRYIDK
jgi:sugar O-acyltransferase (sialic acid O-acetyltransferase NeuD family)